MRTLLIDNYDSYSYNLFQLIAEVNGEEPIAIHNDEPDLPSLDELGVDNVVISPGPGRPSEPDDFGVCRAFLLDGEIPTLGVCLGHQGLGWLYGGRVNRAPEVMHGRISRISHCGHDLFEGIPQGIEVVRYHSLIVEDEPASDLQRLAWTQDGLCMGLRHRHRPLWGVQFHPESVLTECGERLLSNFAALSRPYLRRRPAPTASVRRLSVIPRRDADEPVVAPAPATLVHRRLATAVAPDRVFTTLYGDCEHAVWLDSAMTQEGRARFSFMAAFPGGPLSELVLARVGEPVRSRRPGGALRPSGGAADVFEHLDRRLRTIAPPSSSELPFPFAGGYLGYLGYELKAVCGAPAPHASPHPDAQLIFADRFVAFDHKRDETWVVALCTDDGRDASRAWVDAVTARIRSLEGERPDDLPVASTAPTGPLRFELARGYERYLADIAEIHRLLRAGETYEVCLTNKVRARALDDPLATYLLLRRMNPAPFAAFLRFHELSVLSTSPERFLRIRPDGLIEAKPIKGTQARESGAADVAARNELRDSEKDRAENLMIVDLLRNDLGQVCEIGTIDVPALMAIESFETVHQMVSTVRGRLRDDLRPVDAVRAAFPGGSMTGAPKLRTMEIIDGLEGEARGIYAGNIGYFSTTGAADLSIVIRTIVNTPDGAIIGAGGAIVAASDPHEEFNEMLLKARAPMRAMLAAGGTAGAGPVLGDDSAGRAA